MRAFSFPLIISIVVVVVVVSDMLHFIFVVIMKIIISGNSFYYYYYRDIEAVLNASCIISNHTIWDDEETMASFIDCNETSCSDLVWMVYMQREWLLWKHFRLCALNLALELNLFWILVFYVFVCFEYFIYFLFFYCFMIFLCFFSKVYHETT